MIESKEFQKRAEKLRNSLLAALLVGGHLMAYDAVLDGMDVIVLGYTTDPEHPTVEVIPLVLEITEDLFKRIDVNAVRVLDGETI